MVTRSGLPASAYRSPAGAVEASGARCYLPREGVCSVVTTKNDWVGLQFNCRTRLHGAVGIRCLADFAQRTTFTMRAWASPIRMVQ